MDEGNECEAAAYEQMVRVCNRGKAPLPQLLRLPPPASASYLGGSGGGRGPGPCGAGGVGAPWGRAAAGVRGGGALPVGVAGLEMDSGSILAPLMEKLMETGHLEEFVEQVFMYACSAWEGRLGRWAELECVLVCCSSCRAVVYEVNHDFVQGAPFLLSHRPRHSKVSSRAVPLWRGGGARTSVPYDHFVNCSRYRVLQATRAVSTGVPTPYLSPRCTLSVCLLLLVVFFYLILFAGMTTVFPPPAFSSASPSSPCLPGTREPQLSRLLGDLRGARAAGFRGRKQGGRCRAARGAVRSFRGSFNFL